jgi:hypothetical protein
MRSVLRVSIANVIPAHVTEISALADDELQAQLITAEREAMEAKADYELRNNITHNVVIMDPVLKAVHGGERTGYAERCDTCPPCHIVSLTKLGASFPSSRRTTLSPCYMALWRPSY